MWSVFSRLGPTFTLYSIYISSPLCGVFFLGPTFALYSIYISSPLLISSVIIFYCLFYSIISYQYCVHLCYSVLLLLYWHFIKCSFSIVLSLLLFRANIAPFALYSWFTLFHWREHNGSIKCLYKGEFIENKILSKSISTYNKCSAVLDKPVNRWWWHLPIQYTNIPKTLNTNITEVRK